MGRTSDARGKLIQATIDLIWLHSYGAVSVDAICERSGVKKGSFYHFFRSKDELVIAALDAHWEARRPTLDRLFSPTVPPIERLTGYFENLRLRQEEMRRRYGSVVGCFYGNVGTECAEDNPEIGAKVKGILERYERYYETTLRDADARGDLAVRDVGAKSKMLFAYMEGLLGQARIRDDVDILRSLPAGALQLLGLPAARGGPDPAPSPPRARRRAVTPAPRRARLLTGQSRR